ncbi:NADH:ubiquinone reductase (Na(+)-transporting) subunit B [Deferribacter thermophilus]|uniref:NADH:ubiquinone reductase (Na(+)-transporting) subunit B n=1 Tax=Deferribacter thermophilus TaxID=53573 RepID=UPI003C203F1F
MKRLQKFFEKIGEHFKEGGKYSRWYPLYEATESFFFSPDTKATGKCHIRDVADFKRVMIFVVIALLPVTIFAIYNTGLQTNLLINKYNIIPDGFRWDILKWFHVSFDSSSIVSNFAVGLAYFLPLYAVTMVVGSFWEVLFAVVRKHEISEGFLVTSLLYPLILPPNIPLWEASVALSLGLVLGKELFGGTGMNVVNPALISRAILFFSYPASMTGDRVWTGIDAVSVATPLTLASSNNIISEHYRWIDAFIGFIPGSMGETSTLLCIVGALILVVSNVASWRIMASAVIGLIFTSTLFNLIGSQTNYMFNLPFYWHLVLGGFAFGVAFMATDPVSAAYTDRGRWIYGFLIGSLTVLVRVVNPAYPEGTMLAIIFANIVAPTIDYFVIKSVIKRRNKVAA